MDKNTAIRIKSLDGLRACAVILVLFAHSTWKFNQHIGIGGDSTGISALNILYNGWVGVELFFVLSGFLIASQLLNRPLTQNNLICYGFRRFFRIAPAYYTAITLTFVYLYAAPAFLYDQTNGFAEKWAAPIVSHFFFLHDYIGRQPAIDGVFWSIPVEMKFYLILPIIIYFLIKIQNPIQRVFLMIGIYILYIFLRVSFLSLTYDFADISYTDYFLYIKSPFHMALDGLIVGIIAASAIRFGAWSHIKNNLLFGCALLGFLCLSLSLHFAQNTAHFFEYTFLTTLYSVCFGLALIALVCGCRVNAFFENAFLGFIARISYSIYLTQIFALEIQHAFIWKFATFIDSGFLCWILSLPILFSFSILIASIMYHTIEKPFITWSKRKWPSW